MAKTSKKIRIFSALEIANICGVVNQTAINWIKKGHLTAFITPGGQYRVYASELFKFLSSRGMEIPDELLQMQQESEDFSRTKDSEQPISILVVSERGGSEKSIASLIDKLFPSTKYSMNNVHTGQEASKEIYSYKPSFVVVDTDTFDADKVAFIRDLVEQLKKQHTLAYFSQTLAISFSSLEGFPQDHIESLVEKHSYSDPRFLPKLFEKLALIVAS